jgi:hypothetical protein
MDVSQEIAKHLEKLSPDLQERVLRFVASLSTAAPVGENGATLRQFSASLDSLSAREMIQAIEEECERVDAGDW